MARGFRERLADYENVDVEDVLDAFEAVRKPDDRSRGPFDR